jgi:alkanesulfonate monooxygenase SsuD/methylene tetrahydromethanopterin reductase-like flavin-dependent oxidoreductase (luciferase family)
VALFVDGPGNDAAEGTGAPGSGESGRLVTLTVLAGATTRIRLQAEVLLVPLRQTALLAKQVATLDRLSGGRFTLGVGIGVRDDDDRAAGVPDRGRGARMDEQMARLRSLWPGRTRPAASGRTRGVGRRLRPGGPGPGRPFRGRPAVRRAACVGSRPVRDRDP